MRLIKKIKQWYLERQLYLSGREIVGRISSARDNCWTDEEIAKSFGVESGEALNEWYRDTLDFIFLYDVERIMKLNDKGYSAAKIAKKLNLDTDVVKSIVEWRKSEESVKENETD